MGSNKGSGGGGVALVAAALVVLAGAGGAGGAALNSGASGGGGATPVTSIGVLKWDAKRAARGGDTEGAMRNLGVRVDKQAVKQELDCRENSFGQVRDFLARTPCTALDRLLLAVGDGAGNASVVSVAWVTFPGRNQAKQFDRVVGVHGSGDVRPLSTAVLGLAEVSFTAAHYWSEVRDTTIAIAEAEPAAGAPDPELLDALAEVAAQLPRP
ncbi:hypothetical protein [Saccharothrix syringae]|uniref:Uncharacterized protein n=1 Tax=Saccharothrix syringae TaxID=103733 RepID=A0A5Q0HD45_SACSY|nr:hypothetical protein [Saccharothrix syringae]QFZ23904.1 hypothetical protein EKG83_46425 [Saccharothrix syringae]